MVGGSHLLWPIHQATAQRKTLTIQVITRAAWFPEKQSHQFIPSSVQLFCESRLLCQVLDWLLSCKQDGLGPVLPAMPLISQGREAKTRERDGEVNTKRAATGHRAGTQPGEGADTEGQRAGTLTCPTSIRRTFTGGEMRVQRKHGCAGGRRMCTESGWRTWSCRRGARRAHRGSRGLSPGHLHAVGGCGISFQLLQVRTRRGCSSVRRQQPLRWVPRGQTWCPRSPLLCVPSLPQLPALLNHRDLVPQSPIRVPPSIHILPAPPSGPKLAPSSDPPNVPFQGFTSQLLP